MIQLFDIVTQADSFVILTRDVKKANPKKKDAEVHTAGATRDGRILDHCFTTIKGAEPIVPPIAHHSAARTMHGLPCAWPDKQQLKRVKPTMKTVKQWSLNAVETLRGCCEI